MARVGEAVFREGMGGGGGKIFKTKGYGGGRCVFFSTVELRGVNF